MEDQTLQGLNKEGGDVPWDILFGTDTRQEDPQSTGSPRIPHTELLHSLVYQKSKQTLVSHE